MRPASCRCRRCTVRCVWTRATTSSGWNGFVTKSTAPASSPRTFSRASSSAERKMTAASAVGGVGLEPAAGLVAVHPRHEHVEQDERRPRAQRHPQGVLAARRHQQLVAAPVERLAEDVEVRGVVVDQQDAVGIGRRRGGARSSLVLRGRGQASPHLVQAHVIVAPAFTSSSRTSEAARRGPAATAARPRAGARAPRRGRAEERSRSTRAPCRAGARRRSRTPAPRSGPARARGPGSGGASTCSRRSAGSSVARSSRSAAARAASLGAASSGWSSVSARRARAERRRSSNDSRREAGDEAVAGERRGAGLQDGGHAAPHFLGRRRDRASASTSWPAARGPKDSSAATTSRRRSRRARSGMSAPTTSGSFGSERSAARTRDRSPGAQLDDRGDDGIGGRRRRARAGETPTARRHGSCGRARQALDRGEVRERVRGGGLEVVAPAPQASLELPHVAGPQPAGHGELRRGREDDEGIDRRESRRHRQERDQEDGARAQGLARRCPRPRR